MASHRPVDQPHENQDDLEEKPSSGERAEKHEGGIARLKKFFGDLIRKKTEAPRPKTAKEIRAEHIQQKVDEKIATFPKVIRTGHPEMPEATDQRTERYDDFRKKLLKTAPDDPKVWSLFLSFLEKYPHNTDLLDLIDRNAGKNVDFLKIFLHVSVDPGSDYCVTLIGLKKVLYREDVHVLVSVQSTLTGLSDAKKLATVQKNTDLFKDSFERFELFIEYLEHHANFSAADAKGFIEERLQRTHPYR